MVTRVSQLRTRIRAMELELANLRAELAAAQAGVKAEREREVIARLDTGMTTADIARALGCPARAVERIIEAWRAREGVTVHRHPAIPERRSVTSPIRDEK